MNLAGNADFRHAARFRSLRLWKSTLNLLAELKRRNVSRVAGLYLVGV
jgi:hypothetical protein